MRKVSFVFIFSSILVLTGCRNEQRQTTTDPRTDTQVETTTTQRDMQEDRTIRIIMEPKSGSNLSGNVVFTQENDEVTMTAVIDGLSEGLHAIHLHESADCSAEDGSSAGGHWNPTNERHGEWGDQEGYHKGDIGNFEVDSNGNGTITFSTDEWCIGCDDDNKNIIGKSVVVHDGIDDFTSQPSGDAGTRVGCGSIRR